MVATAAKDHVMRWQDPAHNACAVSEYIADDIALGSTE